MKVLTHGNEIVSFPLLGGSEWAKLDGEAIKGKATVAELPDGQVKLAAAKGAKGQEFVDAKDIMRDLRWLHKTLNKVDTPDGTEVGLKVTRSGSMSLDIPKDARPDRAADLAEGDVVAIGPTVSPKAFMNARGLVVAINGRVEVELEDDDLDRIRRATGKKYAKVTRFHRGTVEKIA